MKKIKRFFNQLYFWLNAAGYLNCKHCCVNCIYYDSCFKEFTEFEDKICIDNYFD